LCSHAWFELTLYDCLEGVEGEREEGGKRKSRADTLVERAAEPTVVNTPERTDALRRWVEAKVREQQAKEQARPTREAKAQEKASTTAQQRPLALTVVRRGWLEENFDTDNKVVGKSAVRAFAVGQGLNTGEWNQWLQVRGLPTVPVSKKAATVDTVVAYLLEKVRVPGRLRVAPGSQPLGQRVADGVDDGRETAGETAVAQGQQYYDQHGLREKAYAFLEGV